MLLAMRVLTDTMKRASPRSTRRNPPISSRSPRKSARLGGLLALAAAAAASLGCIRSADDIQQEFDEVVAESNACTTADECVIVSPGCPLGCFVAVNASSEAGVEAKAKELIDSFEAGGRSCDYECLAPGPVECVEGRCEVEPEDL